MINLETIQVAFNTLIENLYKNRETIQYTKEAIKQLRNKIQILSLELQRESFSDNKLSEQKTLENARKVASHNDCNILTESINKISTELSNDKTAEALNLMEPFINNVMLLRLRLQYIAALEDILKEYENEKNLRQKIKAIAMILGINIPPEVNIKLPTLQQPNETEDFDINTKEKSNSSDTNGTSQTIH